MTSRYRADIDGLRAISVAIVVLFHLGVPGFAGGFVGVDVFFVISGFLITGLILDEHSRGEFSFVNFYARRARRILPMLMTVVSVCTVAGYFLLYPDDYRAFASSAVAALLAWSNFFFLHHTGYFDNPSQMMPLLHTWSLGVEEQFYLVWPAFLTTVHRLFGRPSRTVWTAIFTLVVATSFAIALVTTGKNPKAAFYLPFGRAWELALGALLIAVRPALVRIPRPVVEIMPIAGLLAIATAVYNSSAGSPFPGAGALLPTIGAALTIYPETSRTQRLLAAQPLRFLGLISYSLYLWHWPLIAFWRVFNNGGAPTHQVSIVLATIAIALSVLSWLVIEQPARRSKLSPPIVLIGFGIANTFALCIIATIVGADGVPGRLPPGMAAIERKDVMWNWRCPQTVDLGMLANGSSETPPSCAYGADWATARHRAIIWGDSLAEHLAPVLDIAGRESGTAIALAYGCAAITQEGAPRNIIVDQPHYEAWCDQARDRVLGIIKGNRIDTVLLSTSWSFQWPLLDYHSERRAREILAKGLDTLLDQITEAHKRPIVIADAPAALGPDPATCMLSLHAGLLLRRPCQTDPTFIDLATLSSQIETHKLLKEIVAAHPGASIVDPMDFLCDLDRCATVINGELIYRDSVHLRRNLSLATNLALAEGLRLEKVMRER